MKRIVCKGFLSAAACCIVALVLSAQGATVAGRVNLVRSNGSMRSDKNANVVVWLTPLSKPAAAPSVPRNASENPKIIQRNKRFETRVLAVEVGSVVDFPNQDPFFHNVFSLFNGKRFDLGLYEAGSTKSVRFDKPGVCYIFCNIHSQMSAAVVVVDTPYFTLLNTSGDFQIPQVPPGRYQLNVWAERCSPEALKAVSRQVVVEGGSTTIGTIQLKESRELVEPHSNKYGKDYDPPVASSPIYTQP